MTSKNNNQTIQSFIQNLSTNNILNQIKTQSQDLPRIPQQQINRKQQIKIRSKLEKQKKMQQRLSTNSRIIIHQNQQDKYLEYLVQQQINVNFQTKKVEIQRHPLNMPVTQIMNDPNYNNPNVFLSVNVTKPMEEDLRSTHKPTLHEFLIENSDHSLEKSRPKNALNQKMSTGELRKQPQEDRLELVADKNSPKKSSIRQLKVKVAAFDQSQGRFLRRNYTDQNLSDNITTNSDCSNNVIDPKNEKQENQLHISTTRSNDRFTRSSRMGTFIDKNEQSPQVKPQKRLIQAKKKLAFTLNIKKNVGEVKIQNFFDFIQKVNISNNQMITSEETKSYKVYVGKGNNFNVFKAAFKKRWWWTFCESSEAEACQCVVTQLKNQNLLDSFTSMVNTNIQTEKINTQGQEFDKHLLRILNKSDLSNFKQTFKNFAGKPLDEATIRQIKPNIRRLTHQSQKSHNHIDKNFHISNKKALFYNLKIFCENQNDDPFKYLPVTFHIKDGINDKEYQNFLKFFLRRADQIKEWETSDSTDKKKCPRNIYIVKPGEVTNRGHGISVEHDLKDIEQILKKEEIHKNGNPKTYIIQLYIDRPLLFNRRKFDIRVFMLVTSQNGVLKGYWYEEGYIRTSSSIFTTKNLQNKNIHLTNDAIQKRSEDYGKYESGNKVSYKEFERYLAQNNHNCDFQEEILPQMKNIATLTLKSVFGNIDPDKKDNTFEVFGLDYMLDEDYKVYLIEVNTNPCLEYSSTLLARLIPNMIDNVLKIALDPVFPPPDYSKWKGGQKDSLPDNIFDTNKFELIFDELEDSHDLKRSTNKNMWDEKIYEVEEEFEQEDSEVDD